MSNLTHLWEFFSVAGYSLLLEKSPLKQKQSLLLVHWLQTFLSRLSRFLRNSLLNIGTLSKGLDELGSVINRQEQYSRRNRLLLHGIEEESNESTDPRVIVVLCESMGETISVQDIVQTHRLPGKKPNGKSRPVIVKFVRYNSKNLIFKNKKKLKKRIKNRTVKNQKITNSKRRAWI